MGALVVPADVLNPKDARWKEWATDKVVQAVEIARGRTLVLASSSAMMRHYGMHLASRSSYPVRTQGSSGRNDLIRWFTETTEGVLVATRSFFQGLDVRGESLSCVIIDRVPFDPPGDPLEDTVANMLAERVGGNPFSVRSLPRAGMVLAQASGRLIRSQTDRGVVVMLDSKVVDGMMAGFLRRSFGGLPLSRAMSDIGRVIDGQSVAVEPQPTAQAGRSLRRHRG
jgi:ATP-dependent DNA helicase DinG